MNRTIIFILLLSFVFSSFAFAGDVYVNGYYRKDGSYVQPHYRTSPDSTKNNNYSTIGNKNPYTGEYGTKPRDNYNNNKNNYYKKYN